MVANDHSHELLVHEVVELDGPGSEDDHERDEPVVDELLAYFQRRAAELLDVLYRFLHFVIIFLLQLIISLY